MNTTSTKKPAPADLATARGRARGRGTFARKRLELSLAGVRKASGLTQVDVAKNAEMTQGEVARLEAAEDMKLSTLKRYAEALGTRLDVAFEYPNGVRVYLAR